MYKDDKISRLLNIKETESEKGIERQMNTHHSNTAPRLKRHRLRGRKEKINLNNEDNETRQCPRETHIKR